MTEGDYWDICSKYNIHFHHKPTKEEMENTKAEDFEEQVKKLVNTLSKRGEK